MYQKIILPHFKKQLKNLNKKYKNISNDLIKSLTNFNKQTSISLGNNIYKIRIKSSDIKKGKNKSFRLIIFVIELDKTIYPIAIYFKSNKTNITDIEIKYHLKCIIHEIK